MLISAVRGALQGSCEESRVVAREWRNGRRAGFRCQYPKGCGGSNPPSRTVRPPVIRGSFSLNAGWLLIVDILGEHTLQILFPGFASALHRLTCQVVSPPVGAARRPRKPHGHRPSVQRTCTLYLRNADDRVRNTRRFDSFFCCEFRPEIVDRHDVGADHRDQNQMTDVGGQGSADKVPGSQVITLGATG